MATTTVKSTYSLDVETARALEDMARRWGVSKSEALRRAIRAARHGSNPAKPKALAALDTLQRSLNLDSLAATRWAKRSRAERRASSILRESR
jgi:Ribbon-helix-helix protein, copG family